MNANIETPITDTLRENYMPYAMSVIVSRAIPEIDGLKPAHRKLLYTMYKMGLLKGQKMKSANVVGQTMKLNPHGDAAIYDTMVRLSRGNEALLHPFVDSKGNFGKVYSKNMAYAASRYTEVKLAQISEELFANIDKGNVDFQNNYDNTTTEPLLLPVTFPTVLVNPNLGIAVGMASNICSFNLAEVCETTVELMRNPDHPIELTLKAPDFPTGGSIIYSQEEMASIYRTGRGSFKLRAKYSYDKKNNCIEITEIPYTTTIEAIIEKIIAEIKKGTIKEISDIRDESDKSGLKITIDLKRGTDPDTLMARLYKMTPLQDSFGCNFNILIAGMPKVMGVREILTEWVAFRTECVKRELYFDITKKKDYLHLLQGLKKILLDIDKAVAIIRDTEAEDEVVPNLMIGFGIDQVQAEYIAEIKLRHLNRQYVLKKISEVDSLASEIEDLEDLLGSKTRLKNYIIKQLEGVAKKYGRPRKTEIVYSDEIVAYEEVAEQVDDYPVNIFVTRDGYFKKITHQSLNQTIRMSGDQKLKEGDVIVQSFEAQNSDDIVVITDGHQAYKSKVHEFEDMKASSLGEFLPGKIGMDAGEKPILVITTGDYKGYVVFFFEDGRCAKVPLTSYQTKANRKRLTGAYCDKLKLVKCVYVREDCEYVMSATNGKTLIVNTAMIPSKESRSTQGVKTMSMKGKNTLYKVEEYKDGMFKKPDKYKTKNLPAVGTFLSSEDKEIEQTTFE